MAPLHISVISRKHSFKTKVDRYRKLCKINLIKSVLPGPGSSQIGFAIGLRRAGVVGGFTAFIAFTFPSVLLLYILATTNAIQDAAWLVNITHGLKLLAVVVVADATLNMYKGFCKERSTITICVATAAVLLMVPSLLTQMLVLIAAAVIGMQLKNQAKSHLCLQ